LIPAHDEAKGILETLNDIKPQLRPTDRLLVVADNCTDDTAAVAASAGAEVTVRSDVAKIGKGYALDWGLTHLASTPPDIVIMIDADCSVTSGTIDRLTTVCEQSRRPVQSLYLMTAPTGPAINHQVAEFAWRVKNWVRPSGLGALGLPCQLMGSGMAFPWAVIRSVELSSGFIVEDLKLGLDLAKAGHAPIFCPSAVVKSTFPTSAAGSRVQRHRWEQGHLSLILIKAPALIYAAARRRDINLLALALDLAVPPISLFGLILLATLFGTGIFATLTSSVLSLGISATCVAFFLMTTFIAWLAYGRLILPPTSLPRIASYIGTRFSLYWSLLLGHRVSRWVRSDRSKLNVP